MTLAGTVGSAAQLMTSNPISLLADAPLREAFVLLTTKGISASPVVDQAGRPVGVLTHSDLLIHVREQLDRPGTLVKDLAEVRVRDVMTPAVFSVAPDMPAAKVVDELLALNVHHLFVVDAAGVLVGVISALDIVRHLRL